MESVMLKGDCRVLLPRLPDASVHCCVTSPPYFGLRDYGNHSQIGLEDTPEEYVAELVAVFREVRRVLRDDGTLWLNLGDTYYSGNGQPCGSDVKSPSRNFARQFYRWQDRPGMGLPKKSLVGIPWRVAFALQADGWTLRSEIIWHRPSAFTGGNVHDRPLTKHETLFMFSKARRYFFAEDMAALGSVWTIEPVRVAGHSAAFPDELARRCVVSGCPPGGVVLDPFAGSGTVLHVAEAHGRKSISCELVDVFATAAIERNGLLFAPKMEVAP